MGSLFAFGLGIGTRATDGRWLEVFYPAPVFKPDARLEEALRGIVANLSANISIDADAGFLQRLSSALRHAGAVDQADLADRLVAAAGRTLLTVLTEDSAPAAAADAYLKLHLLSHRHVLPNQMNLQGIFAVLPNVAWTSEGAIAADELNARQLEARIKGRTLTVHGVDKFPRMADYVVPNGVRIADASRVRLGAYVGSGTTVMHEGLINFNAGALGPNMIEGRISQGVTVGAHSDLGGSASLMGTLSGGGTIVISLGEHCLVGANAGSGIPLGNNCTIAAGVYITAGTIVEVIDEFGESVRTVKARELAGGNDMLFINNSRTGRIQCRTNRKAIELNDALHAHN